LLEFLAENPIGWAAAMGPAIMGNPGRPELAEELTSSFCRTDPRIARAFAGVTFRGDNRSDLAEVTARTLILQCSDDVIAPPQVGAFVRDHIKGSTMVVLRAVGHCPNLSSPEEVIHAIKAFV
jgi:sigma-B regulation protein RsbQ